jgi:hypothetical protein
MVPPPRKRHRAGGARTQRSSFSLHVSLRHAASAVLAAVFPSTCHRTATTAVETARPTDHWASGEIPGPPPEHVCMGYDCDFFFDGWNCQPRQVWLSPRLSRMTFGTGATRRTRRRQPPVSPRRANAQRLSARKSGFVTLLYLQWSWLPQKVTLLQNSPKTVTSPPSRPPASPTAC